MRQVVLDSRVKDFRIKSVTVSMSAMFRGMPSRHATCDIDCARQSSYVSNCMSHRTAIMYVPQSVETYRSC